MSADSVAFMCIREINGKNKYSKDVILMAYGRNRFYLTIH